MRCWINLDYKRKSTLWMKTSRRKSFTRFGLTPLDVHIQRDEASDGIASRDTQVARETPSQAHRKSCRRRKADLPVLCALSVWRRE